MKTKTNQTAEKASYIESMKEMGLGGRAKKMLKFAEAMNRSRVKKAGDIVIYDRFPEIESTYLFDEKTDKIVEIKISICELPKGTELRLLEDCNDGEFGIYVTDKGDFFVRNLDMVRPSHGLYEDALIRGYIKE